MRGRKSPIVIELTDEQRQVLQYFLRCPNKPAGLVRRARAVLMLAEKKSFTDVQRSTGLQRRHARKWALRFKWQGVAGLEDKKRPGRKPVFSPARCDASGEDHVRAA